MSCCRKPKPREFSSLDDALNDWENERKAPKSTSVSKNFGNSRGDIDARISKMDRIEHASRRSFMSMGLGAELKIPDEEPSKRQNASSNNSNKRESIIKKMDIVERSSRLAFGGMADEFRKRDNGQANEGFKTPPRTPDAAPAKPKTAMFSPFKIL